MDPLRPFGGISFTPEGRALIAVRKEKLGAVLLKLDLRERRAAGDEGYKKD